MNCGLTKQPAQDRGRSLFIAPQFTELTMAQEALKEGLGGTPPARPTNSQSKKIVMVVVERNGKRKEAVDPAFKDGGK